MIYEIDDTLVPILADAQRELGETTETDDEAVVADMFQQFIVALIRARITAEEREADKPERDKRIANRLAKLGL